MKIRSLFQAVAITAASLTMAGASWSPACAQNEDPLFRCLRTCGAVYGPGGPAANPTLLRQCQQNCCAEHGGC